VTSFKPSEMHRGEQDHRRFNEQFVDLVNRERRAILNLGNDFEWEWCLVHAHMRLCADRDYLDT